jgi:hypothetical protein
MLSVAELVGVYGAVVATGVFIWNVVKNRPRIKIDIWGIPDEKRDSFDITVEVISKSGYPFKIDYYGFDKKKRIGGTRSISSPLDEVITIPGRDHHILRFGIADIRLEFSNNEVCIFDTFYTVDRTARQYTKRLPNYILEQAQMTPKGKKSKG